MDIAVPVKNLGPVDVAPLIKAVLAQDEASWFEQDYRQKSYDVHKETSSIVMIFCDDEWPNVSTFKDKGWDKLESALMPTINRIIAENYPAGGTILRAMVARLHPKGRITPHVDAKPSFHAGHRVHIPLVTNPACRFTVDGRPYKFEVGQAYEINNQKPHSVINNGRDNRLHIIFDYMPKGMNEEDDGSSR
ncbi:aspartyl/asparaginyl beta-hydroxylase domain-containing protein [Temperatibacter marinus]|uniref:Aspartyl/asparaginyl beta-hydroxylase domain-containing protein n=1 Tax=Temperatibacter marinus TaxID=1456591 RepID=A0AA52EHS1_9PROT|nr:aspartyl/asparaginyl beta-hydroxylase domain-containing protein [Temperatibacter marinus]WND03883.1 aspartyl/asparaginyl beta-hydroxylase domain-containing protein [Temperatibacter marinus]